MVAKHDYVGIRLESSQPRDSYDLAAVAERVQVLDQPLAEEVPDALPNLIKSLRRLDRKGRYAISAAVIPSDDFMHLPERATKVTLDVARRASDTGQSARPRQP